MNFNIFVRDIYIVRDKKQFVCFICYSSDKHRNVKCRYSQMCFIPSRFQSQLKIFVFGKIQIYIFIRMRNIGIGICTIRLCGPPKLCEAKIRLVPRLHSVFTLDARSLIFLARVSTRSVSLAIYKIHISIAILRRGQSCIAVTKLIITEN